MCTTELTYWEYGQKLGFLKMENLFAGQLKIEDKSREQKIENRIEKGDYKLIEAMNYYSYKKSKQFINKSCLF